ncbi:MAG: DUF3656 domain-containing protein [Tepidisphaeraceae bacterium]
MLTVGLHKPELLCPAGDFEAMRAAVANGADAVYFGLDHFNVRHRATNFTLEKLPEVMRYLHRHNVKGFVTFNVLVFSDELPEAVDYVKAICAAGVDAVIVQDLGVARLIHRLAPKLAIHASTQMTLTEPRGLKFARNQLGITRAVLAREMSVAEIAKVTAATDLPVEVFIHGALCVAYSGQCLTSESLGGRSANRGQCAQACRMPYELIVDGQPRDLGDVQYLVSPTDLGGWDAVHDLVQANVASFKIEGRLKSAHYVASTAQVYRRAIDAAESLKFRDSNCTTKADAATRNSKLESRNFSLSPTEIADLEIVYTRGFSPGFLGGVNHQQLVPGRFPKARGKCVGVVSRTTLRGFVIDLDPDFMASAELRPGDGIVFDQGDPESEEAHGHVYHVDAWDKRKDRRVDPRHAATAKGKPSASSLARTIHIELGNNDARPDDVQIGAIVWKNHDPQLEKRLEQSFARDRVVHRDPIDLTLHAHVGQNTALTMTDGTHTVRVEYQQPLEPAQKFPIAREAALRQLDRFLDTPFALRDLKLDAQHGPMVPNSILADLRRRGTDELIERRHRAQVIEVESPNGLDELRRADDSPWHGPPPQDEEVAARAGSPSHEEGNTLHVLVRTLDQLDAVLSYRERRPLGTIYADFEDVRRYKDAVERCRSVSAPLAVATMRIIKPGEEGWLQQILKCDPPAILVRNLAGMGFFREFAPHLPLIGDYSLNVANELTAQLLLEAGLIRMVPSYDLSWKQMAAMVRRISGQAGSDPSCTQPTAHCTLPLECVIHQHMPMFHMEHCVFAHTLSAGKDYRDCGRPCETHRVELRDQKAKSHPLIPDAGCRNTLFNADAQSALDYLPRMQELGIRHFRIELLRQSRGEVASLLDTYLDVLEGKARAKQAIRSLKVVAQLGVTSGTFDRE